MDLQNLSSNWKKLQQKLKTETSSTKPPKRKSPHDQSTAHRNGVVKRPKITAKPSSTSHKARKMGLTASKASAEPRSAAHTSLAAFAAENDISASSLSAAYGPRATATSSRRSSISITHPARINEGLSPNAHTEAGKFVALDCEMVGVGPTPDQDSQLARVSMVNYHGVQIYDSFVLPVMPVTDYRTFVSGIQPHHLKTGYARSFSEVQTDVAGLLDGRVLVGHALKNDLHTLMLSQARRDIRDTSRHPTYRQLAMGKTPGLKRLAKEVLGVEIQAGEHSSVEDARAAMSLYKREKEAFEEENRRKFGIKKVSKDVGNEEGGGNEEEDGPKAAKSKKKKKKKKGKK